MGCICSHKLDINNDQAHRSHLNAHDFTQPTASDTETSNLARHNQENITQNIEIRDIGHYNISNGVSQQEDCVASKANNEQMIEVLHTQLCKLS